MSLKIQLWGIRGSLPAPQRPQYLEQKILQILQSFEVKHKTDAVSAVDFLKSQHPGLTSGFGGHTSCVEVSSSGAQLIVDGGSGLRPLGDKLMATTNLGLGKGECHILMTHFHWDHLIGIPFFTPLFIPGNEIHFWAVQPELEENIRRLFKKPNFPVDFEQLGAKLHFHKLKAREPNNFGSIHVTPYLLDHPDECWGFRMEAEGKAYAHCIDTEMTRVSPQELGEDLPLYQNVDMALLDAQYTFLEANEKINWGHASAPVGLDLALREGIKEVYFVHHDPAASDEHICKLIQQTQDYHDMAKKDAARQNKTLNEVRWQFAIEGSIIEL